MKKSNVQAIVFTGLMVAIGVVLSQLVSITRPTLSSPIIKFVIGYLPIILISILYGPVYGIIAAISQDLLGFFLIGGPQGQIFFLGFTINAILYGLVPGLLFRYKSKKDETLFYWFNYGLAIAFLIAIVFYFFNVDRISTTLEDPELYILLFISLFGAGALIAINFWVGRKKTLAFSPQKILFVVMILYMVVSIVLTPIWLYIMIPGVPIWLRIPLRIVKMPVEVLAYVLLLTPLLNTLKKLIDHHDLDEPENN